MLSEIAVLGFYLGLAGTGFGIIWFLLGLSGGELNPGTGLLITGFGIFLLVASRIMLYLGEKIDEMPVERHAKVFYSSLFFGVLLILIGIRVFLIDEVEVIALIGLLLLLLGIAIVNIVITPGQFHLKDFDKSVVYTGYSAVIGFVYLFVAFVDYQKTGILDVVHILFTIIGIISVGYAFLRLFFDSLRHYDLAFDIGFLMIYSTLSLIAIVSGKGQEILLIIITWCTQFYSQYKKHSKIHLPF